MKLFIDTANLDEIKEALEAGYICGITTNPSLLAKEPKADYLVHMQKIVDLARRYGRGGISISIEVFTDDPDEMIAQAGKFWETLRYKDLAIKIHISHKGRYNLRVVKVLSEKGIAINCTACMTPMQAMTAAAAGAKYVSLFYNRIRDGEKDIHYEKERKDYLNAGIIELEDFDPTRVVRETKELLADCPRSEIIVGSIRTPLDIKRAGLAGAHIVMASSKILKSAMQHFKTDEAVDRFFKDFESWTLSGRP